MTTSLRQKYKASRHNNKLTINSSSANNYRKKQQQQQKHDQHLALLANRSPPPSPSPFGLQRDPNVSALFPGVAAAVHQVDSFDAAMMMAVESSSSSPSAALPAPAPQQQQQKSTMLVVAPESTTRLPPQNRFLPQHQPRGSPALEQEELCPTEGALQFVPAYAEATTTTVTNNASPTAVTRMVTASEDDDDDDQDVYNDHEHDDYNHLHNHPQRRHCVGPTPRDKHYDDGHKHYVENIFDDDMDDDHSASWGAAIAEEKKTASPVPKATCINLPNNHNSSILVDSRKVLNTPQTEPFRRKLLSRSGASGGASSVISANSNTSKSFTGGLRSTFSSSRSHAGVADRWCTPNFRPDPENDKDQDDLNSSSCSNANHYDMPDETASAISLSRPTTRGPRIRRLASLFASRATVKGGVTCSTGANTTSAPVVSTPLMTTTNTNTSHPNTSTETPVRNTPGQRNNSMVLTSSNKRASTSVGDDPASAVKSTPAHMQPPSPSRSSFSGSTSSGYVAWPGTQDKKGKTVAIESSYDDSSVGAAAFHRSKEFEDVAAVGAGGGEWMDSVSHIDTSLEDSFESTNTPSGFHPRRAAGQRHATATNTTTTTPSRLSPPQNVPTTSTSTVFREETLSAVSYHLSAIATAVDNHNVASPPPAAPSSVISHRVSRPRVYNMATNESPLLKQPNQQQQQQQQQQQRTLAPTTSVLLHRPHPYQRSTSMASRGGAASSVVATSVASTSISIQNLFNHHSSVNSEQRSAIGDSNSNNGVAVATGNVQSPEFDPWDVDNSSHPPSSPGTSISRGSSAYFNANTNKHRGDDDDDFPYSGNKLSMDPTVYGVRTNVRGAASVMRRMAVGGDPQPPTEDTLALNDHFVPPHRNFNSPGYTGFLDKTKDVPNLMDVVDSDSLTSSKATSSSAAHPQSNTGAPTIPYPPRRRNQEENRLRIDTENRNNTTADHHYNDADSDVFEGITPQSVINGGGSDVFEGLSNAGQKAYMAAAAAAAKRQLDKPRQQVAKSQQELNLVLLGSGLSTIQTPNSDYTNRNTASDFDDNLTNSEVDQFGFAKVPGFYDMARAGRKVTDSTLSPNSYEPMLFEPGETPRAPTVTVPVRRPVHTPEQAVASTSKSTQQGGGGGVNTSFGVESESGSSSLFSDPYPNELPGFGRFFAGDLSQYYVQPDDVKKIIRKFRRMGRYVQQTMYLTDDEMDMEEDAKKAFALFEMRSRIMETDIDRGLERRGGTTVVDDLVLTSYNLAAQRVRDAVIVSKAWRDGASPKDVVNSALLTRRAERTYYIPRPVRYNGVSPRGSQSSYWWEEVRWLDDTDFMQYRCPSLGPRYMRGFEMFTIGDCQSILLKLTNERCMELRAELNCATAQQIDAEELMKEEGDDADGMMTAAEMVYLASMEEVKTISRKLVVAEKAFSLVRDRIEKLVAKYEALLVKIENESYAPSSIATCESSYYSDDGDSHYSSEEDREKEMLARRAQRAELRAELAVREALLRRQEVKKIQIDKQREIEVLHGKLAELQSESSHAIADREHSVILARAIAAKGGAGNGHSSLQRRGNRINQTTIEGVKQKFRDRMAAKLRVSASPGSESGAASLAASPASYGMSPHTTPSPRTPLPANHKYRLAGEEMFQALDFYERSLKAVESPK